MDGSHGDTARRAYLGMSRGTLVKADDSKKLQEVTIRDHFGDRKSNVESFLPYGFSHVPLPPDDKEAEVIVAFLGGNPDHPVVVSTSDRRHRPKNLKPGESAHHDDQKQITKVGRDGIETTGKKVEITGGGEQPKGDTANHELNEQLKGMAARLAQSENAIAGLHNSISKFRQNAESVLPALVPINLATQVTAALNKLPSGLDAMAADVQGQAQAYLQKTVEQALQKFLSPNLAALTSVLSGGVEGAIGALKAQITDMIASNPVIAQVDALREELTALTESGGAADVVAKAASGLQNQIAALVSANPIMNTIDDLRSRLAGLIAQAGPGLHFMEPQKRLVQGITRSMRFGGPG